VSAEGVYNGFYRWNHRRNVSVGDSIGDFDGESATSLYGYPSLNPSVKSSEKTPRHHTVASFQTNCIGHRRYSRYIPTEIFCRYILTISPIELCHRYIPTGSPTELCHRYIPTELETELFPLVRITDENILSVIPLVFAGFLVVLRTQFTKLI
jgi:hypothetical protein